MTTYALEINEHNTEAFLDIEDTIQKQKNGLLTFILRINNSNVVDFNKVEYADIRKYLVLKRIVVQELSIKEVL